VERLRGHAGGRHVQRPAWTRWLTGAASPSGPRPRRSSRRRRRARRRSSGRRRDEEREGPGLPAGCCEGDLPGQCAAPRLQAARRARPGRPVRGRLLGPARDFRLLAGGRDPPGRRLRGRPSGQRADPRLQAARPVRPGRPMRGRLPGPARDTSAAGRGARPSWLAAARAHPGQRATPRPKSAGATGLTAARVTFPASMPVLGRGPQEAPSPGAAILADRREGDHLVPSPGRRGSPGRAACGGAACSWRWWLLRSHQPAGAERRRLHPSRRYAVGDVRRRLLGAGRHGPRARVPAPPPENRPVHLPGRGFGDGPLLNTWSGASWSPYEAGVDGGCGTSGATAEHVAWSMCGYSCEVTGT